MTVKIDPRGIESLLKSAPFAAATKQAAEAVAENVRSQGIKVGDANGGGDEYALPVEVYPHPTDSNVVVALAHPSGEAVQAKHGSLTKAAAQAGLDVTAYYTTKAGVRRLASQAQIDNWTKGR